jgi:hypothetical protein
MHRAIPAVRILPMSSRQKGFRGRTVEDVQAGFFLEELPFPPKSGRFRYPTSGLNAEPGTVVLFQYEGKIIASAVFERNERFARPEGSYRGAMWFDVESIRIFEPVGPEKLRSIWPEFQRLGHAKQDLDPVFYPAFEEQLVGVEEPGRSRARG